LEDEIEEECYKWDWWEDKIDEKKRAKQRAKHWEGTTKKKTFGMIPDAEQDDAVESDRSDVE
jgi:hypothetical protein